MPMTAEMAKTGQGGFEARETDWAAGARCHNETAQECQGRTCHRLIDERAVSLGGVDEDYAAVHGRPEVIISSVGRVPPNVGNPVT